MTGGLGKRKGDVNVGRTIVSGRLHIAAVPAYSVHGTLGPDALPATQPPSHQPQPPAVAHVAQSLYMLQMEHVRCNTGPHERPDAGPL